MTSVSVKRTIQVAALTVAFTASGSAMALAGTYTTSGNNSILGGNQVSVPVSLPVNICGNALALLGDAFAGCVGGASVNVGSGDTWTTSGNNSIGGGNQVSVPISVPVNVCGNSAAALGTAASGCQGGASVNGGGSGDTWTTSGNNSIGGGNQVSAPISVPVNVCGNAVAILGTALAACQGGASTGPLPPPPPPCHHPGPPPCHHHPGVPPSHHGGTGTTTTSTPTSSGGALPTTGANILGLLVLAGGITLSGAGSIFLVTRRGLKNGLLAVTRRAAHAMVR